MFQLKAWLWDTFLIQRWSKV